MSVTGVTERFHSRSGSESESSFSVKRVFHVVVNDVNDDFVTIKNCTDPDLPKMWEEHPGDSKYIVNNREGRPMGGEGDQFDWEVTVSYTNKSKNDPSADITDDPTKLPPEISFDFETVEEIAENAYAKDNDIGTNDPTRNDPDVPVRNSARDPFDPPLYEEEYRLVIDIKRNETPDDYDPNLAADYEGTINKKQIMVGDVNIAAYEGLMREFSGSIAWDADGNEYWVVTYRIVVNRKTWIRKVLDRGYYTHVYGVTERKRLRDEEGIDVTVPQLLDGGGAVLAEDADPVFIDFQTKWLMEWNNLNLPVDKSGSYKRED